MLGRLLEHFNRSLNYIRILNLKGKAFILISAFIEFECSFTKRQIFHVDNNSSFFFWFLSLFFLFLVFSFFLINKKVLGKCKLSKIMSDF